MAKESTGETGTDREWEWEGRVGRLAVRAMGFLEGDGSTAETAPVSRGSAGLRERVA